MRIRGGEGAIVVGSVKPKGGSGRTLDCCVGHYFKEELAARCCLTTRQEGYRDSQRMMAEPEPQWVRTIINSIKQARRNGNEWDLGSDDNGDWQTREPYEDGEKNESNERDRSRSVSGP